MLHVAIIAPLGNSVRHCYRTQFLIIHYNIRAIMLQNYKEKRKSSLFIIYKDDVKLCISDILSARYRGRLRRSSSLRIFLVEKRKDKDGE